jgi:hypothetical protein
MPAKYESHRFHFIKSSESIESTPFLCNAIHKIIEDVYRNTNFHDPTREDILSDAAIPSLDKFSLISFNFIILLYPKMGIFMY